MRYLHVLLDEIRTDKSIKDRIIIITVIFLLFIFVMLIKPEEIHSKYIIDANGDIIGIERMDDKADEKLKFKLLINDDKSNEERIVEIDKRGNPERDQENDKDDTTSERELEIDRIITDIEFSNEKIIKLPSHLNDGSKLKWQKDETKNFGWIFIPIIYFALLILVIREKTSKKIQDQEEHRKEIIKGLPRFTNQLLLMLNAGMILSDAVERAAMCYSAFGKNHMNYFESEFVRATCKNKEHRISAAVVLNEWAKESNVKELMRISTILTENERRGSDVAESLSRESKYLWDERKIVSREAGKLIDTKMAYPMGFLLILLIVITMAPALLNI